MQRLKAFIHKFPAKRRIGFMVGLVNTVIIILVAGSFLSGYYLLGLNQIRSKLTSEAEEIVRNHLVYDGSRIVYRQRDEGQSIRSDLYTDGASAVIYNAGLEPIGNFGLFELQQEIFSNDKKREYSGLLSMVLETGAPKFYSVVEIEKNNNYEMLLYPITSGQKVVGVVCVANQVGFFQDLLQISVYILLTVIAAAAFINFFLGGIIAKIAYKPLENLREKMHQTTIQNINEKVIPEGHPTDDSYLLAKNFNEMLERVNEGIIKQRQFISNASHELKSPLARAVSRLEVIGLRLHKKKVVKSDLEKDLVSVKQDLVDLASVIEDMLLLSRIREQALPQEGLKVSSLIRKELKKYPGIKYTNKIDDSVIIRFNKESFRVVIKNLVENAIKYGVKGSLEFYTLDQSNRPKIVISNRIKSGLKIDTTKLFERFSSHSKHTGGHGLGLSIVKSLAEDNGYEVRVDVKGGLFLISLNRLT
ncbi:HAMP domain-containing histidine kinase [Candidatus Dojkabacteria bacterium]|uniref:histidine kinase n=1 Tax=Candidatus Dojkabacteria bacterium TaxID=2099670 RepID=A0A955I5U1_9BACT|nr:HAMP domain-containing histidine kinase [Candidatus Dojkabacteria bacterium]MCB9790952.1 HAMP domain-containing histidine kinase [Candidatus Nomurabacteria bacterium]